MSLVLVGVWTDRIAYSISFICISYLIKSNWSRRTKQDNLYERLLNFWSLSTMICFQLTSLLMALTTLPTICVLRYYGPSTLYLMGKVFLIFYQIARLQYCFSKTQIHSERYGYSICFFRILYCNGFIYIVHTFLYQFWDPYRYLKYDPNNEALCQWILITQYHGFW
eukprot:301343_1